MNSADAVPGDSFSTRADSANTMPSCAIISPIITSGSGDERQRPASATTRRTKATTAVIARPAHIQP